MVGINRARTFRDAGRPLLLPGARLRWLFCRDRGELELDRDGSCATLCTHRSEPEYEELVPHWVAGRALGDGSVDDTVGVRWRAHADHGPRTQNRRLPA